MKFPFFFLKKNKKSDVSSWTTSEPVCQSVWHPSCCWRCCCLFFSFSLCVVLLTLMIWPLTCASAALLRWRMSFSLTFHFVHRTSWTVVGLICVKMISFILYNTEGLCEYRYESYFLQEVRYRFIKSTEWSLTLQRTACVFTLLVLRDQLLAPLYMDQGSTRCHCN